MLVLGFQGSPRKKGNTHFLLSTFMRAAEKWGAQTHIVEVAQKNVLPCKELIVCEKKGYCPIDDDMRHEIYALLRQAEVVVLGTPIFFYNMTAQMKAVVDRCQTLWARKYIFNLKDPAHKTRRGFLLSVAATKGKHLFEGLLLTTKYFFDAIDASFAGSLTYREIEGPKDMASHPAVIADAEKAVKELLTPFLARKKVLFACRENACRSQMASAFAQYYAGDKLEAFSGGSHPANTINPDMAAVMAEKGIDMAYRIPQTIDAAISHSAPEFIITMGCNEQCPHVPGSQRQDWDLPDPAGKPLTFMRAVCAEIEQRVKDLIPQMTKAEAI